MAHWHHLFGLLSVLCISFGALFLIFNSDFGEVCDYSQVIESCSELKTYIQDPQKDNQSFQHEFKVQAQDKRNASEVEKCIIEEGLQAELQSDETTEAKRLMDSCMNAFRECADSSYTTPTTTSTAIDCSVCNRYCLSTRWVEVNPAYAALMGGVNYAGACTEEVCPWQPQCETMPNSYFPEPPTGVCNAPCNCKAALCPTTTTTGTTTTSTTVTTTTTTSTTTTATSFTTTTTTTSTTTSTTVTTTTVTTSTTTTTTTATTTTSTAGCVCQPAEVVTAIVGRPMSAFRDEPSWTYDKMLYYQGVVIETSATLYEGQSQVYNCRDYFSDRNKYYSLRYDNINRPHINSSLGMVGGVLNANDFHPDLGCGYSGTFSIDCVRMGGTCGLNASIKTCAPPTYTQAVTDCLAATTTTTPFIPTASALAVPDWLEVEELPYQTAGYSLFSITTTTTSEGEATCCEAHVGSVCNPHVNFDGKYNVGPTLDGRWQPNLSFMGMTGYFPTVPCSEQAKWKSARACPRVRIKELPNAASTYALYPACQSTCNLATVQMDLQKICNRTGIAEKEEAAHLAKIAVMQAKKLELEAWTKGRMRTVEQAVTVTDCIGDTLPRRYNGMGLPSFRSGFEKLPLHSQCRLHGCKHKQCLKITRPCRIPFLQSAPEQNCGFNDYSPSFECQDKVGINSNDPMSIGFTIAWMIIGSIFFCASIAAWIRNYSREQEDKRARPTPVTETAITKFGAT